MLPHLLALSVCVAATALTDLNFGQEWVRMPLSAKNESAASMISLGLAALHNFEYGLARLAFRESMKLEPGLTMSYVGLISSFIQGSWSTEQPEQGAAVLAEWDNLTLAGQIVQPLAHEAEYMEATRALVNLSLPLASRHQLNLEAMRKVAARYPNITEIQLGLVVSLLTAVAPSDFQFYDRAAPLFSEMQALLVQANASVPLHPGVHHYFVHIYDSPQNAHLGLDSARVYGSLAPDSPHANHMPVHIFIRLGMWEEAARGGQNAIEVSMDLAHRMSDPSLLDHHSLQFHVYVLLQLGQWEAATNSAKLVVDPILTLQAVSEGWQEGLDFPGYDAEVFPMRVSCPTCDNPNQTDFMFQLSYQVYVGTLCNTGLYAAGFNRSAIVTCPFQGCVLVRPTVVNETLVQQVLAELQNVSAFLAVLRPDYALIAQIAANMVTGTRLISTGDRHACQSGLQLLELAAQQELQLSPYTPGPQTMIPSYELYAEMLLLVDSLHLQVPGSSNSALALRLLANQPTPHHGAPIVAYDMNRTRALFLYAQAAARLNQAPAASLFEHVLSNYHAADTANRVSPVSRTATARLQSRISFATAMRDYLRIAPRDSTKHNWLVPFVVAAAASSFLLLTVFFLFLRLRRMRRKTNPFLQN